MNIFAKLKKKGFSLGQLPSAVIILVIIAIVLSLGATVLGDMRADQTADSFEYNATTNGLDGLDTISGWQDTIALIVAVGVILGIVGYALMRNFRG